MARGRQRTINLPAPYLKRLWLDRARISDAAAYPLSLPFLRDGFDLSFDRAISIIVGENGTGKSTLLEGIAALAGFDEAGGGKGSSFSTNRNRRFRPHGRSSSSSSSAAWTFPGSPR